MKPSQHSLSLTQPMTYRITVPGRLDELLSDWAEGMIIAVEQLEDGTRVTTLTGTLIDQAALQGLLRRLYALGLPLISVSRVEPDEASGQSDAA